MENYQQTRQLNPDKILKIKSEIKKKPKFNN